jgi:hypothetical protein
VTAADDLGDAVRARPIALVRGDATPEEVAALMVVLASAAGSTKAPDPAPRRTSGWVERSRLARQPLGHRPDGWRGSALPR